MPHELAERAAEQTADGKRRHDFAALEAKGQREKHKTGLDREIIGADGSVKCVLEQVHSRALENT